MVLRSDLAQKMSYISAYYGRSRIKEIEWACKRYIDEFEKVQGKIELPDEQDDAK